jgi:F-type H+-transporting ATPase subunit delta
VTFDSVARVYANSFYELGEEKGNILELIDEFKVFSELFKSDEAFNDLMLSPAFGKDDKHAIIKGALKDKVSEYTYNFISAIIENGRLEYAAKICDELYLIDDEMNNRMNICVTVTESLNTQLIDEFKKVLSNYFKKEITITEKIDNEILGGVVIMAGDKLIDASLLGQLNILRSNLLNSKVGSEFAYES